MTERLSNVCEKNPGGDGVGMMRMNGRMVIRTENKIRGEESSCDCTRADSKRT